MHQEIEDCYSKLTIVFSGRDKFIESAFRNLKKQIEWAPKSYFDEVCLRETKIIFKKGDFSLSSVRDEITVLIPRPGSANLSLILNLLSIKFGHLLIHGACVLTQDGCHVLAAHGGVGKTSLLMKAESYESGASFGGDDLVLLKKDGSILPIYRPMCLYRYHYSLYQKELGIKVYFLKPDIVLRALRKVVTNIFNIDWYQNKLLRRLVPYNDYYLHSAEKFLGKNLNMPLILMQLAYLERAESFRVRKISETELKKRVLNSLEREFDEQKPLLTLLSKELYDQSWIEWLDHSYDGIMPSTGNLKSLIHTNGQWKKNDIKTLLESC